VNLLSVPHHESTPHPGEPIPAPPVVSLIGKTPIVPLVHLTDGVPPQVSVHVKLEGLNPGGSVKDRPASYIVRDALLRGELRPGKTLLDATSGNTGIAYAMLGAAYGFPVELALPADSSPERIQILRAYGAHLILTDPAGRTDESRRVVREMVSTNPERYFYADQYNNPANPLAHFETTGPEIWHQTSGKATHFVAGMGTSGTMMGVGCYLRTQNPAIRLMGVQPTDSQHRIDGLKYLESSDVPGVYNPKMVDEVVPVHADDASTMARRLAREEGLFVGISSGAAVAAALRTARRLTHGCIVAILPDGGFKYASATFWAE
jgi:S-sulfo-L-cysteine synthase (O-acetyl-L-serine-dependent)